MRAGIALIPEDRRGHAIVPMMTVEQNFGLANQKRFAWFGALRNAARRAEAEKYVSELQIRPPNIATPMANLSGGNQQKVVIARWLLRGPGFFCSMSRLAGSTSAPNPKFTNLLRRLAKAWRGSFGYLLGISRTLGPLDRIGIMRGGQLVRSFENCSELNEDLLMQYATRGGLLVIHDQRTATASRPPRRNAYKPQIETSFDRPASLFGGVALFSSFRF